MPPVLPLIDYTVAFSSPFADQLSDFGGDDENKRCVIDPEGTDNCQGVGTVDSFQRSYVGDIESKEVACYFP